MRILKLTRAKVAAAVAVLWLFWQAVGSCAEPFQIAATWGHYDFRVTGTVLAACLDFKGRQIVAVSTDGISRTWSLEGQQLNQAPGSGQLAAAAFSVDCRHMITATPGGEFRLFDAANGPEIRAL